MPNSDGSDAPAVISYQGVGYCRFSFLALMLVTDIVRTPIPKEMDAVCTPNTSRKAHSCVFVCDNSQVLALWHENMLIIQCSHFRTEMMKK